MTQPTIEELDEKFMTLMKQWDDTHDAIMSLGHATPESMTDRMKELHQQRKWMSSSIHNFSRLLGG